MPRIQRNGATKTASLQTKTGVTITPTPDPFAPPKNADEHPSCICIYDREAGKPVQIVSLTSAELVETLSLCLKPGCPQRTSGDVIAEAIREKLRGPQLWEALAEIEDSKNEVVMLLERIDGGDLNPMIERQSDRLSLAVENAFHALRGEPLAQ